MRLDDIFNIQTLPEESLAVSKTVPGNNKLQGVDFRLYDVAVVYKTKIIIKNRIHNLSTNNKNPNVVKNMPS